MIKKYVTFSVIFIVTIFVSLFFMVRRGHNRVKDKSFINGTLDLSEWNGNHIDLVGDMLFYPDQLFSEDLEASNAVIQNVPHYWQNDSRMGYSPQGKGTYVGYIKGLIPAKAYGFQIQEQGTSFKLYINRVEHAKNGDVVKGIPEWRPLNGTFFANNEGEAEIIIEVANYDFKTGGYINTLEIGYHDIVFSNNLADNFFTVFIISGLFIMGILFIWFCLAYKKKIETLYFALLCLDISFYTLLIHNRLIHSVFGGISWNLLLRLEFLSCYILLPLFSILISELVAFKYKKITNWIILIYSIATTFVCLLTRTFYLDLLKPYQFLGISSVFVLSILVIRKLVNQQKNSYYIVVACGAVLAAIIKEIFFYGGLSALPIAAFIMVIAFSLVIIEEYVVTTERITVLEKEVGIDKLTGLYNRHQFLGYINKIVATEEAVYYHLLFLDLDGFKLINDLYGHHVGDKVLKISAQRLRSVLRSKDFIARYGGDEFVILLCEESVSVVKAIAERLIKLINQDIVIDHSVYNVGVSVGINKYSPHLTVQEWVEKSDHAMYIAKKQGKNQYC